MAEQAVRRNAAKGVDITYLHRTDRTGYKAGALEAGMQVAKGEYIAIFDADFIPTADFLQRTVPFFVDPKIAMVQARWGHINADYSLLTKIQSILLDAHFVLEHGGRNRAGLFFNFNGTAGIWRRTAIVDAGGWQHDTLTEDLDLSYRAQSRGWKFVFLPDLVSPAELPVEMNSFKSQQHRWAKGSIQTCRKVLPAILRSNLPFNVKAEAFFHLTANFNYPLMCVLSVLMAPSMVIRYNMGWYEMLLIDVPLFFAATASVANFYMVCQRELHKDWMTRLKYLPFLMSIGIGLAVNNTKAVFEALFNSRASSRARRSTGSKARATSGSARSTARTSWCSRSSSWPSACISPPPCSTRWPTASTARCRSWCSSRSGSCTPACCRSSSSTPAKACRWIPSPKKSSRIRAGEGVHPCAPRPFCVKFCAAEPESNCGGLCVFHGDSA